MSIRFSIIIPVFNRAGLIAETLDSVFAGKSADDEVLVVDDGSTDGTADVVRRYGGRIVLLQQNRRGPGAARNLGLRRAHGDYIACLDSDDHWFPWTLATYRQVIEENGRPAFVAGAEVRFSDPSEFADLKASTPLVRCFPDYYAAARENIWIGTGATAIRADVLRQVGGFAEDWINAEDCDLWLKLGTASGFIQIPSPPVFAYRQHADSAVNDHEKTHQGISFLVDQERHGRYPGGDSRRWECRCILARHARPAILACLRRGQYARAWTLYGRTLAWHLQLLRLRFVVGFPPLALLQHAKASWKALVRSLRHPQSTDSCQARLNVKL